MRPILRVDTSIVVNNWKTLNRLVGSTVSCVPVVKANAYGLGVEQVSLALTKAGVASFFVADATEGSELRKIVGGAPEIYILGGYIEFYSKNYAQDILVPLLNSSESAIKFLRDFPHLDYGVQIETGLNRFGTERLRARSSPHQVNTSPTQADNQSLGLRR